jgi:Meiotically Up-regulated Gene 113 (MUG113) protein
MAHVYVLRSGNEDVFKIGRTRHDVDSRRRGLATGNPHPLTVFDVIETEHEALCETFLHRRLRSRRVSGEFFAVVPEELEAAIRETRELLADLVTSKQEVKRLAQEESDGLVLKPGSAEWSIYENLLEVREAQDHYAFQRELLENKLKLTIGTAEGLEGIASWKTQERRQFDEASFKLERPELFQTYVKLSRLRVFRLAAGRVLGW